MQIKKIGYGRASIHDFESSNTREYCYMEADIEPWEDVDKSLALLRSSVCSKVGIYEDFEKMEEQREVLKIELEHFNLRISEATQKWNKIDSFMKKLELAVDFDPIPF